MIGTGTYIKFTDNGVTTKFLDGDNVIICIGDEKRYVGTIASIGTWSETKDSEKCFALFLDTSKSATSYSGEVIRVDDITYICKNPLVKE